MPNPIKQAAKPRLSGTAAPIISRRLPKIIQKALDASCGGAQRCYDNGGYSCYEYFLPNASKYTNDYFEKSTYLTALLSIAR